MRIVYAGDTTNGGHPGERPCAPRRQTHTHVYLAARRRLPRVHVRRGGLIIHLPWLRRARRKRHRRRLHPHAQVLTHHTLTNDAVSARRFKVYTNATLSHALWEQSYVIRAAGAATRHRLHRLRLHRHRLQARRRVRVKGGSGQLEAAACATHRSSARSWRASWRAAAGSGQKKCASGSAAIAQRAGSTRWWNAPLAPLAPFLRFWIHTSSLFFCFGSTQVTLWVLDPRKLNFGFGSTQVKFGSTQQNFPLVSFHRCRCVSVKCVERVLSVLEARVNVCRGESLRRLEFSFSF